MDVRRSIATVPSLVSAPALKRLGSRVYVVFRLSSEVLAVSVYGTPLIGGNVEVVALYRLLCAGLCCRKAFALTLGEVKFR